jgi:hypothetical protein
MFGEDSPTVEALGVQQSEFADLEDGLLPLFYVVLRRDLTRSQAVRAHDASSNLDIVLPAVMEPGINRLSMMLRAHACDCHYWSTRSSEKSRERAVVAAQEARYLSKIFEGVVLKAAKAIAADDMSPQYRCGLLNRVLWRHLLVMGQGLMGRRMFAVLIGVGNYNMDILTHGGEHELVGT